jgi:hypothetical protein
MVLYFDRRGFSYDNKRVDMMMMYYVRRMLRERDMLIGDD